jgi:hypothetical protein
VAVHPSWCSPLRCSTRCRTGSHPLGRRSRGRSCRTLAPARGREPPFLTVKRPACPCKSPTQNPIYCGEREGRAAARPGPDGVRAAVEVHIEPGAESVLVRDGGHAAAHLQLVLLRPSWRSPRAVGSFSCGFPLCIPSVILHTKRTGRHQNDSTAHGYNQPGMQALELQLKPNNQVFQPTQLRQPYSPVAELLINCLAQTRQR